MGAELIPGGMTPDDIRVSGKHSDDHYVLFRDTLRKVHHSNRSPRPLSQHRSGWRLRSCMVYMRTNKEVCINLYQLWIIQQRTLKIAI